MHLSYLWKTALLACAALLPAAIVAAEETAPAAEETAGSQVQKLQQILFSREQRSDEEFAAAQKLAKDAGASAQQLLDAEVFRAVMQETKTDLRALADRLEKALPTWNTDEALSIHEVPLGQSLAHFLRAKAALQKDDEKGFQTEAALSIWAYPQLAELPLQTYRDYRSEKAKPSPELAALDKAIAADDEKAVQISFAAALWSDTTPDAQQAVIEKVTEFRDAQKMASIVLPLDLKFEQAQGEPVSLAELLKGKKAALLDFHASWCGPCMQLLPNLPKEAEKLAPQGVVVIAFNTQDLADAKKIQQQFKFALPVLAEKNNAYSGPLGVNSIPRYVLVSAEGKILFNGHPMDKENLNAALKKVGVQTEKE